METTEKPAFPEAPPDEATAEVEARLRDALSLPLDDPRRQRLVCASRMLVQDDKKRRRRTRTTIRRAGQGATRLLQQEAAKLAAEVAHVEHDLQKPAGESLRTALALLLLIGLVAAVLARFLEKLGVF